MAVLKGIAEAKVRRERPEVEKLRREAAKPDKPKKEELKRLNVEIHRDALKQLKVIAMEQERPLAELVRSVIDDYLKRGND